MDAERGNEKAASPAEGRDHAGLARTGMLQPMAEKRRRGAEEYKK